MSAATRWVRCVSRPCRARPHAGRIFLCYRWDDTKARTDWLCNLLERKFGPDRVFQDPKIEPGEDYREAIRRELESCEAVLVMIGRRWLARDETGHRRIDGPHDQLRREVEMALESDARVRVIPILVDGAQMPRSSDLPPSLARLAYRIACELSPNHFERDVNELLISRLETPRRSRFGRWGDVRSDIRADVRRRVPAWALLAHALWRPLWANTLVPLSLLVGGLVLRGAAWLLPLALALYLLLGAVSLFDLEQARCVRQCLQEMAREGQTPSRSVTSRT